MSSSYQPLAVGGAWADACVTSHRVSQSVTKCHKVPQSVTKCHKVSQSVLNTHLEMVVVVSGGGWVETNFSV